MAQPVWGVFVTCMRMQPPLSQEPCFSQLVLNQLGLCQLTSLHLQAEEMFLVDSTTGQPCGTRCPVGELQWPSESPLQRTTDVMSCQTTMFYSCFLHSSSMSLWQRVVPKNGSKPTMVQLQLWPTQLWPTSHFGSSRQGSTCSDCHAPSAASKTLAPDAALGYHIPWARQWVAGNMAT